MGGQLGVDVGDGGTGGSAAGGPDPGGGGASDGPVRTYLERLVPYDKSLVWSLQDAYFSGRGHEPWTRGEIPYQATSVLAAAQEHARFVADYVAKYVPGDAPVEVVEAGCGNGLFAQNFLRALERSRRPADKALFRRIRYVVTDWTAEMPEGALQRPLVAGFVASGKLTGGIVDFRHPWLLVQLDGFERPLAPAVLITNYVVCVLTPKILHKSVIGAWFERHVRVGVKGTFDPDEKVAALIARAAGSGESADIDLEEHWVLAAPEDVFGAEVGGAVRALVDPLPEATFTLSPVFVKALRELRQHGTMVLVNDFGFADLEDVHGLRACNAIRYGLAMSHPVDFALYDAVGPALGYDVCRTLDQRRSVRAMAFAPALEPRLFNRAYRGAPGDDWLDLSGAGRLFFDGRDAIRAARTLGKCLEVDPLEPEVRYRHAQACIEAGLLALAARSIRIGARVGPAMDWAFVRGRLAFAERQYTKAIRSFQRSLELENSIVAWLNLARCYEAVGDETLARRCYRAVLELEPDNHAARRALMLLGEEGSVRVRY